MKINIAKMNGKKTTEISQKRGNLSSMDGKPPEIRVDLSREEQAKSLLRLTES